MADDIVAIGGSKPGADERFEALFRSEYESLAATPGVTERQVQRAFLRLWRRRWLVRDATSAIKDLRSGGVGQTTTPGPIDVERAWREFQDLRTRGRRKLAIAVGGAALILIASTVLVVTSSQPSPPQSSLPVVVHRPPRIPPSDPGAITARFPVSNIGQLAAAGGRLWAVRGPGPQQRFQLVEIDPATGRVGRRVKLAWQPASITAGAGMVWLGTPFGRQRGQVLRVDAATGRQAGVLHLPVGRCFQVAFGAGSLWAGCQISRPFTIEFLRIDPRTGRVVWRSGPVLAAPGPGQGGTSPGPMTVAPDGLWYATSSGVAGFIGPGLRAVTVRPRPYTINLTVTVALLYSDGFVWAMAGDDGSVAKIDPATGRVLRIYTFFRYGLGQAISLAVAHGSLWLLDNGDFASPLVLRASIATGLPTARVGGRKLCGDSGTFWECGQIYATAASIWVPAVSWLVRIDPARLTARSVEQPENGALPADAGDP